jgi:hypothetical protein
VKWESLNPGASRRSVAGVFLIHHHELESSLHPRTAPLAFAGSRSAGVSARQALYVTSGEDAADDRYLRRYEAGRGFDDSYRVPVPELTGSYLSFDGENLYLSQWYKHRLLQLDFAGGIQRTIAIGAEISGHVFVDGHLYVLRGTEEDGEHWHVARLDLREETPGIEELAHVPFACRSLAYDGSHFWTNHRAANETVSFALPGLG